MLSIEEVTAQMQRVNAAFELAKRERKPAQSSRISQERVEAELIALATLPDAEALAVLKTLRCQVGYAAVNLAFKAIYQRDRLTGKRVYCLVELLTVNR